MGSLILKLSVGLIVSVVLYSGQASAEGLCKDELKPFYSAVQAFDGSEDSYKVLIKSYHKRRQAVYGVCGRDDIRKFETAYREKVGRERESDFEKMSFFPKPRKTLDLGEIRETGIRKPASKVRE